MVVARSQIGTPVRVGSPRNENSVERLRGQTLEVGPSQKSRGSRTRQPRDRGPLGPNWVRMSECLESLFLVKSLTGPTCSLDPNGDFCRPGPVLRRGRGLGGLSGRFGG